MAALFLIVVLAMLGVFAVRMGAAGEQDALSSIMRSRALAAARAGMEYGAYRGVVNNACSTLPAVATTFNVNLTQGALNGFTLTVTCSRASHLGATYFTWQITSTARRGTYGTPDYVASPLLRRSVASGPPPP